MIKTCNRSYLLHSTLGEDNPNFELDGFPVLYKPRNFEIFCSWTAIWMPLLVFAEAGLVFESGRPYGRILIRLIFIAVHGCCTWLAADIVTILSCLCYNLNGQKLLSNTLSTQSPNVPNNLICLNLAALYETSNSLVYILKTIRMETQAELEVKGYQNVTLCGARF